MRKQSSYNFVEKTGIDYLGQSLLTYLLVYTRSIHATELLFQLLVQYPPHKHAACNVESWTDL